jgi:hypothetical protein
MFDPYSAEIKIKRERILDKKFNIEAAVKFAKERNHKIARTVVQRFIFNQRGWKLTKRAQEAWTLCDRINGIMPFLDLWNEYREKFEKYKFKPWIPKDSRTVTIIENIMHFVSENGLDLERYVLAGFYAWRKSAPPVNMYFRYGYQWYERYGDKIEEDLFETQHEYESLMEANF